MTLDVTLTPAQRTTNLLITRTLDNLYWVMSYSRWKDERYWPQFREALKREHPSLADDGLMKAKEFNAERHYQGIGRFEADAAMDRGLADLGAVANLIEWPGYVHGDRLTSIAPASMASSPTSTSTTLRKFAVSHESLAQHCRTIHAAVNM